MRFWWHHTVLGHTVRVTHVTVPLFDLGARGLLYQCICGKDWAL